MQLFYCDVCIFMFVQSKIDLTERTLTNVLVEFKVINSYFWWKRTCVSPFLPLACLGARFKLLKKVIHLQDYFFLSALRTQQHPEVVELLPANLAILVGVH